MSDGEADGSILRRVFLKLGATGAAGLGWLDSARAAGGPTSVDGDAGVEDAGPAPGTAAREVTQVGFLPPRADVLSLEGLDDAGEFGLSSVASDHAVDRRPLSVRELVTPQNPRSTTDADTYRDLTRGSFDLGNGRVLEVLEWIKSKSGERITWGDRITWGNWLQDPDHMTQATVVGAELSSHGEKVVASVDDQRRQLIGTVVRTARGSFRGMGSGHSHSEAAMPDEGFNDLKDVEGELPQPDRWIKDDPPSYPDGKETIDTNHLVRVGAGTMLKTLNRAVLPSDDPSEDLALPNMGSWDGQTLAGAINTATHGTGLELGSLADIVRSVEILVVPESPTADEPLVRMLRIEPEDGITDPVAFARDAHAHDMTLIQDDDLFHSVVVGYGSMGIVYAYTLECRDAFWLSETNSTPRWSEVDPVRDAKGARHYKVNIDLSAARTDPQCWVRRWRPASADGRRPTERKENVEMIPEFLDNFTRVVDEALEAAGGPEQAPPGAVFVRQPPWDEDRLNVEPFESDRRETASYIALRRRSARHPDDPEKPPEQPQDVISTEVIVPLSETEAAAQAVIDHVHRHDRWFPLPMSIRYAAGSEHYLSPEYGLDDGAAVIEFLIPVLEGLRRPQDDPARAVRAYLDLQGEEHLLRFGEAKRELEAVEDILVDDFDGRPHLGKHNTVDVGSNRSYMRPGNLFPEYDTWLAAHEYVNQYGTFDAKFTDNKVR